LALLSDEELELEASLLELLELEEEEDVGGGVLLSEPQACSPKIITARRLNTRNAITIPFL